MEGDDEKKKLQAGKKRLEEFRKKKEAKEKAALEASSSSSSSAPAPPSAPGDPPEDPLPGQALSGGGEKGGRAEGGGGRPDLQIDVEADGAPQLKQTITPKVLPHFSSLSVTDPPTQPLLSPHFFYDSLPSPLCTFPSFPSFTSFVLSFPSPSLPRSPPLTRPSFPCPQPPPPPLQVTPREGSFSAKQYPSSHGTKMPSNPASASSTPRGAGDAALEVAALREQSDALKHALRVADEEGRQYKVALEARGGEMRDLEESLEAAVQVSAALYIMLPPSVVRLLGLALLFPSLNDSMIWSIGRLISHAPLAPPPLFFIAHAFIRVVLLHIHSLCTRRRRALPFARQQTRPTTVRRFAVR